MINAFQQKYPGETPPNESTKTLSMQRFRDTGSVADKKRSGRASIVKAKVAHVDTALRRSPMKRLPVYINIIMEFLFLLKCDERYAWSQQVGATCHTSLDSMEVLTDFFDDRVISKGLWRPISPG
ncbi:DUF4817 domain-containing protein [Trichonephila clavipes]|nr:DUF4817 domain-containing protein [Trichonephila clavipes]